MAVNRIVREPQKGNFGKAELFALAIGQVIGAGVITYSVLALKMTGYSVWLAYLVAIALGLVMSLPMIFMSSAFRVGGGFYSVISSTLGAKAAGVFVYMWLPQSIMMSMFAISAGEYLGDTFAIIGSPMARKMVSLSLMVLFVVVNLLGRDIMARFQKGMVWVLIASLLMYIGFGIGKIHLPIFNFSDPNFMPFGMMKFDGGLLTAGFFAAVFVLIQSTQGHNGVFAYGAMSKNPKKDAPFAVLLTTAFLVVLYVGVAIVACGTMTLEEYGASTTLVFSAKKIMPPIFFYLFIIGGPLMALTTTLNASISSMVVVIGQACDDGWLPKKLGAKNKHGAYVWLLLIIGAFGVAPILFNFSIGTLLNNIQLLLSGVGFLYLYAIYKLPDKHPEVWKRNTLHVPGGVHKLATAITILLTMIVFVKSCMSVNATIVIVSVSALIICIVLGVWRAKTANVTIYDSLWAD